MAVANREVTPETDVVEAHLRRDWPNVEAYRYNPASIRIRIIDERFRGKSKAERFNAVIPSIRQLPKDTEADVTMLVLLAPGEEAESLSNFEFEHPTPTAL